MKKILISLISLIIILLGITVLIRSNKRIETSKNEIETQTQNIPYPTGIFPEDIIWGSSECLHYSVDSELFDYCIDENINKISNIEQKFQDILQRKIKIGQTYICETYNFIISDPNQIATKIVIYDNPALTSSIILESNFTLKVDKCEDPLTLLNALPSLEKKQYIWKHKDEFPSEEEIHLSNIKIIDDGDRTSLYHEDSKLLSFQSVAVFVQATSNENNSKFALIDSYGEMWIV
jgi:hypothetical protein